MSREEDRHIKLVLFDLDGTIYLSGRLISGAKKFLRYLTSRNIQYGFMTNNSSIGPMAYLRKLRGIGLDVSISNIVTSAEASCLMLQDFNVGSDIFILGTKALKRYMACKGYRHRLKGAQAVLVGFDLELRYSSLCNAVRLIIGGKDYFSTHPDVVCPSSEGALVDAGAILAAIEAASGKKVKAIAGKPNKWIVKLACKKFGVNVKDIMIVGDRLETDIRMANRYKMRSALVLTGVTNEKELRLSKYQPDIVVKSIGDKKLLEYEF